MHDYKSRSSYPSFGAKKRQRWPLVLLTLVVLSMGIGFTYIQLMPTDKQPPQAMPTPGEPGRITLPLAIPVLDNQANTQPPKKQPQIAQPAWTTLTVSKGDTLSSVFSHANLNHHQLYQMMNLPKAKTALSQIHPGDTLDFQLDENQQILALRYPITPLKTLLIQHQQNHYQAQFEIKATDVQINYAAGSIKNSLFADGIKAGLSNKLVMELVTLFGWDIDFALDLREGDNFTVIYESQYDKQGEKIMDGHILAAEFINRGKIHRALRYTDRAGKTAYYDMQGHPMRKAFLRTPVKFSRISSHFNPHRRHPILNTIRAHRGVDYAARTGTPIYATAAGKIQFKGRKGGYGNTLVLKHGQKYSTLYAHLSRYANGLKSNQKVHQGQLIGYVGQTGRATGPHLHYEFRVNGVHKNPLTVKLPRSKPLPKAELAIFTQRTASLAQRMTLLSNDTLAFHIQ